MKPVDRELEKFLNSGIFRLHQAGIDNFLMQYQPEAVNQCLIAALASLCDDEVAWKLGRKFGYVPRKHNIDVALYRHLCQITNLEEKIMLISFLSGYWEIASADPNALVALSNDVRVAIQDGLTWSNNLLGVAIHAIVSGYTSNRYRNKENVKEGDLKFFLGYVSQAPNDFFNGQFLIDYINDVIKAQ